MSSSLVGCVDGDQIETTRDESEITGVQNTPTRNEQLLATAGKYRDVLYVWSNGFGCTGTVIAPHAVLTARHCIANAGATGFVGWSEFGYMSLPFTNSYTNPYLEPGRRPDWWVALDEQQKASGGRTDDWPAMHDHAVLFVPGLTQAVLDQMRVQLAQLDPNEPTDHYAIVGVGSTGGARRDWGDTRLVPATPNAITNTSTRDGYLTRDGINYGSSIGDAGDSGGPTFGFQHVVLPRRNAAGTTTVEIGHALVGTTQNSLDMAPLAYVSNMTPNQRDTVRLNQLWIAAAASDADGDGLPLECDPNPGDPSTSLGDARCPGPVGSPKTYTKSVPVGLLQCKPGWVPTGIAGRSGWLIDQLRVRCQPINCLETGNSAACESYWTDELGGDGGVPFTQVCQNNAVITGIDGLEYMPSGSFFYDVNAVQIRCSDFQQRKAGDASSAPAATMAGATWFGTPYTRKCDSGQILTGFEARSSDRRWLTGLQPICASVDRFTRYIGGQGGAPNTLRCPHGTIATGTIQRSNGWVVDQFALLCTREAVVNAAGDPRANEMWVVQAGFRDTNGTPYTPRVSTYAEYLETAPAVMGTERLCGNGYKLGGLMLNAGALIDKVRWLSCAPAQGAGSWIAESVDVGGSGGGTALVSCVNGVDGLFIRNGDLLDGLALRCH